MPKTRALTAMQREKQEIERASDEVLKCIRSERGLQDKTYEQMAEVIGVSRSRLFAWRNNGLGTSSFASVVTALHRLGYQLDIVPAGRDKA